MLVWLSAIVSVVSSSGVLKNHVFFFSLMADRTISIHGFSFSGMDSNKIGYAPTSLYLYNSKKGMSYATSYTETSITNEGKDRFSVKFKMPITIRPNEWYISSEMTIVSFCNFLGYGVKTHFCVQS